jgi:hypothetical protein
VKVHRVVLAVIDFDRLGADGVVEEIENVRYPNDCRQPEDASASRRFASCSNRPRLSPTSNRRNP